MPFVNRDADGNIISVFARQQYPGHEFVNDETVQPVLPPKDPKPEERLAALEKFVATGDKSDFNAVQLRKDEAAARRGA